jgi:hypothetical protein
LRDVEFGGTDVHEYATGPIFMPRGIGEVLTPKEMISYGPMNMILPQLRCFIPDAKA